MHPVGTTETSDLRVCPYWNATDFFRNRTDETEFYDHVRSLMPLSPLRVPNSGPQTSPVAALFLFPAAGVPSSECSLWVKSRHMQCTRACPLRLKADTGRIGKSKIVAIYNFCCHGRSAGPEGYESFDRPAARRNRKTSRGGLSKSTQFDQPQSSSAKPLKFSASSHNQAPSCGDVAQLSPTARAL